MFSLSYPPSLLQWLLPSRSGCDPHHRATVQCDTWLCSVHNGENSIMVIHCLYVCYVALSQLMQNKFGEMALITASGNGHHETAKLLLQRSALVNYQRKVNFAVCGCSTWCARLQYNVFNAWWRKFSHGHIHCFYVRCVALSQYVWRNSTHNSQWQWTSWNSKTTPIAKCFGQLSEKGECCSMWTGHMACQATV